MRNKPYRNPADSERLHRSRLQSPDLAGLRDKLRVQAISVCEGHLAQCNHMQIEDDCLQVRACMAHAPFLRSRLAVASHGVWI